ncbi:MAG: hypothetical protein ACLFUO_02455 [Candidatus Woesearchaeota archaeon]
MRASTPALDVVVQEEISQIVAYDQTVGEDNVIGDTRGELGENNTGISRTGVELKNMTIVGTINISNIETIGPTDLVSINVTINNTQNITNIQLRDAPSGNYFVYNISTGENPVDEPEISIFIPLLKSGDSAVFNFSVDGVGVHGEPLNFTEEYTSWRMMTGRSVDVNINATNSLNSDVEVYDIIVIKEPEGFPAVGGGNVYFNFTDISGEDASNASIDMESGISILQWNVSDNTLTRGESTWINFKAWAPLNISTDWHNYEDWGEWMRMGNLSASFKLNASLAGLQIKDAKAKTTDFSIGLSKDRINESHWNGTINMSNTADAPLDYNVSFVSIWATKYQTYDDPGNISTWINNTNVSAYSFSDFLGPYANVTWRPYINLSGGTANDQFSMIFNYSLVPIIWSDIDFFILEDGNQVQELEQAVTSQDGYLFIEEIYVLLGGYLIKSTKTITPIEMGDMNNTYQVNITLENVGTETTPEWITMFDMVPRGFNPLLRAIDDLAPNRSMAIANRINVTTWTGAWVDLTSELASSSTVLGYQDSGEITSGAFEGYWGYRIDFNALNSTSNGNGIYDPSHSTQEIGIRYRISGNNTISSIENAYIVGVDPIRLEGGNPSRSVSSLFRLTSSSGEYLLIIISLAVSVIIISMGVGLRNRKH